MKILALTIGVVIMAGSANAESNSRYNLIKENQIQCESNFQDYTGYNNEFYEAGWENVLDILKKYKDRTYSPAETNQKIFDFISKDILRAYVIFAGGEDAELNTSEFADLGYALKLDLRGDFIPPLTGIIERGSGIRDEIFNMDAYRNNISQEIPTMTFFDQADSIIGLAGIFCKDDILDQYYLSEKFSAAFSYPLGFDDNFIDLDHLDGSPDQREFFAKLEKLRPQEQVSFIPWMKRYSLEEYLDKNEYEVMAPDWLRKEAPNFVSQWEKFTARMNEELRLQEEEMYR